MGKLVKLDMVLRKRGPLTDGDWDFIHIAPVVGAAVVSRMSVLSSFVPALRADHEVMERADGPASRGFSAYRQEVRDGAPPEREGMPPPSWAKASNWLLTPVAVRGLGIVVSIHVSAVVARDTVHRGRSVRWRRICRRHTGWRGRGRGHCRSRRRRIRDGRGGWDVWRCSCGHGRHGRRGSGKRCGCGCRRSVRRNGCRSGCRDRFNRSSCQRGGGNEPLAQDSLSKRIT